MLPRSQKHGSSALTEIRLLENGSGATLLCQISFDDLHSSFDVVAVRFRASAVKLATSAHRESVDAGISALGKIVGVCASASAACCAISIIPRACSAAPLT